MISDSESIDSTFNLEKNQHQFLSRICIFHISLFTKTDFSMKNFMSINNINDVHSTNQLQSWTNWLCSWKDNSVVQIEAQYRQPTISTTSSGMCQIFMTCVLKIMWDFQLLQVAMSNFYLNEFNVINNKC